VNKNDLIKWALIAGAAYLVFRYLQAQGMLGGASTPSNQTALPGGAKAEEKPADTPPADFVGLTRDGLHNYAISRMPPAWNGRLTISEWNWMTSHLTGKDQQATLPGGPDPITVEEYLALRKGAGISSLVSAFAPMTSGWAM